MTLILISLSCLLLLIKKNFHCRLLPCSVNLAKDLNSSCDVVCVLDKNVPKELIEAFSEHRSFDKAFDSTISIFRSKQLKVPVIYSPVGELGDYDDVRAYQRAAEKAISRAVKAGCKSPLLLVPSSTVHKNADLCSVLGALHGSYVPLQLREDIPEKSHLISSLNILFQNSSSSNVLDEAVLLESGRFVARDIGGGDPERMAPPRVAEYVKSVFPDLKVDVIEDHEIMKKEFPCFAAVDRAARSVARHHGRIIFLEYIPPNPAKKTLCLVGKGVCYDTGGADIKAGGVMAGMSRDKCGAASVAGFMQVVQHQKPQDVHVIAALCMVRNSVGEECYVADEIITSRAGVRMRVGNTDAEGRMAMVDSLCKMRERVEKENLPNPHLFTVATLTGHACLAAGDGYSIAIDNSVARNEGHCFKLQELGNQVGDPFEVSYLRKDDFDFNNGKVLGEDILQANNAPSSRTPRGHQVR